MTGMIFALVMTFSFGEGVTQKVFFNTKVECEIALKQITPHFVKFNLTSAKCKLHAQKT